MGDLRSAPDPASVLTSDGDDRGTRSGFAAIGPVRGRFVRILGILTRVLHAGEDEVLADHRPAGLGPDGDREELLGQTAVGTTEGDTEQSVVRAQLVAVGGDPQVAVGVEGHVVRARDRADAGLVESAEVRVRVFGIAADEQQPPRESRPSRIAIDFQHLSVLVAGARVRFVRSGVPFGSAVAVVRQCAVDASVVRVRFDVLGTVHLGRVHRVRGRAGEDVDLLGGELGYVRLVAGSQWKPGAAAVEFAVCGELSGTVDFGLGAVAGESADVERALVEQSRVVPPGVPAVAVLHAGLGDELVDVLEPLVIAGVRDDAPVLADLDGGALVFEPAEGGVLDGGGIRVVRVDFDDPAEAVGFVRFRAHVPALVEAFPFAVAGAGADSVAFEAFALLGVVDRVGVGEVLVDVLLAGEDRSPRGLAARAVVQRAADLRTARVGVGAQEFAAGGGAAQLEFGVERDPAVVAARHRAQSAVAVVLDGDDGQPVRSPRDPHLLLGRVVLVVGGEHVRFGGVLVVDHEQLLAADLDDFGEVVVVTELLLLGLGGLAVEVELGRVGDDRVAPADHDVLPVPVGDGDRVPVVGRDGWEAQSDRCGAGGRGCGDCAFGGLRGAAEHCCAAGAERDDTGAFQRAAAVDDGVDDVAEVGVLGGVGGLVRALVTAAVPARGG